MKNEYNLTLNEMVAEIFQTNGWYQGDDFSDSVFLTIEDGVIVVKSFSEVYFGDKKMRDFYIGVGTISQKYRRVYTQPEIMRKI